MKYIKICILIGVFLTVLVLLVFFYTQSTQRSNLNKDNNQNKLNLIINPKNATHSINGEYVKLKDGKFEQEIAPNSASKTVINIYSDIVYGDLNSDGIDDSALILSQKTGGSGTFYYVVSAIKTGENYIGTNGIFLGDRIKLDSVSIENGFVVVDMIDRKIGEDFSVDPSVSFTKQFGIENGVLKDMMNSQSGTDKSDKIKLSTPTPGEKIASPLIIEGDARGNWFFEASFPVVLTDWDGVIIAQGVAQAQSDWMTNDFVKFKAELNFKKPELYNRGSLILKKDNPSGLPENDDSYEITVFFE